MQQFLAKAFPALHVLLYRLTQGNAGSAVWGMPVLLLTTVGRRSGRLRTTPLAYIAEGPAYVVVAANAGQERPPAWLLNLQRQPRVLLQIRQARYVAHAKQADPAHRRELWVRLTKLLPAYDAMQQRMQREIPLVILQPLPE